MSLGGMRLRVVGGDGIVARSAECLVVVGPGGPAEGVQRLLEIARVTSEGSHPGRALAYRLAGFITESGPEGTPDFAALADAEEGMVVVIHGSMTVTAASGGGEVSMSGADRPTWVDEFLPTDVTEIRIGNAAADPAPLLDLVEGVVPGAGVVLMEAAGSVAAPEQPGEKDADAPPPEDQEEAPPEPAEFAVVDLTASVAAREPLAITGEATTDQADGVVVDGIRCARGHFNHPQARFCSSCGLSMVQQTHVVVEGVRPPLGVLVFDDGRTLGLDSSYVIGRDPGGDDAVQQGDARPFPLEDPDQILSRIHVEVRLSGWDVELIDRRSANGTFVRAGEGDWERLDPAISWIMAPGSRARVGRHEFAFDSHHRPSHD